VPPRTVGAVTEATRTADGTADASADVAAEGQRIAANIGRVIQGKPDVVRLALVVLLAEGHLLIEDVPGVGKTTLAKALAASVDASVRRIQFTPDLLPSDVTGVSVYDQESREFEFKPGAIFANVVVADEINRASPKTQAALLECMEERQVTVDGVSYELARPFMVMATQNPIEMEGTYPLPEAQRDRFTARLSMGYPDREAELAMLDGRAVTDPLTALTPVADAARVRDLVAAVGQLHVSEAIRRYVVLLVEASRRSPDLRLGASPRAGLQLLRAARAYAALAGRDHVLPDDVQALATAVLAHRLLLTPEATLGRTAPEQVVEKLVAAVPVPRR
jgi:MoxR-like ATPase